MSTTIDYHPGEYHPFSVDDHEFLYLVPSGGIFELSAPAAHALRTAHERPRSKEEIGRELFGSGVPQIMVDEVLEDLVDSQMLVPPGGVHNHPEAPPAHFPLQSMVLNLTNQCNLSCKYCYEYGEDKVATPDGKPKFMDGRSPRHASTFLQRLGRAARLFTSRFSAAKR